MARSTDRTPGIVMTDPECIALESLADRTRHFVFDEEMLRTLQAKGLAEPAGRCWQITARGRRAIEARAS
jgi:hypothetical protein